MTSYANYVYLITFCVNSCVIIALDKYKIKYFHLNYDFCALFWQKSLKILILKDEFITTIQSKWGVKEWLVVILNIMEEWQGLRRGQIGTSLVERQEMEYGRIWTLLMRSKECDMAELEHYWWKNKKWV